MNGKIVKLERIQDRVRCILLLRTVLVLKHLAQVVLIVTTERNSKYIWRGVEFTTLGD